MATPPLPPSVSGPIYTTSTQVLVGNVFPDSTVNVYNVPNPTSTTTPVGTATTPNPCNGSIWVPLTTKLGFGQQITATQTYMGSTSAPSPPPLLTVLIPPDPLPAPIFVSGLCTCMDSVYIGGLIPGAKLTITMGGTTMVSAADVTQSPQWFPLLASAAMGAVLNAYQKIGSSPASPTTSSAPPITMAPALEGPDISPQPLNCQTSLSLSHMQPGADLIVTNGGTEYFATSAWSSWGLVGLLPLQPLPSSVQQYFTLPSCANVPKASTSFTVAVKPPPAPFLGYKPCADVTELSVSDVVSGEILSVAVKYTPATPPGATPVTQPLGSSPVSGGTIYLPKNWYQDAVTGPVAGSVTLQITGSLCGLSGPTLSVPVVQPPGPFPAPTVQQPVYQCATSVFIQRANPGSYIQVWAAGSPPIPRSAVVLAAKANFPVLLNSPLTTQDKQIYVTQTGCSANEQSPSVSVSGPPPLQVPTVAGNYGYVLPTDTSVLVNNVAPGAQVTLLLNGKPIQQVDSIQAETGPPSPPPAQLIQVSVPVGSPLKAGDVLTAGQWLCSSKFPSAGQGGSVMVQAPVPAPPPTPGDPGPGLFGNSNYIMYTPSGSGCANLLNVSVTIQVTEDIVFESIASGSCLSGPIQGFGFQLNCYSPTGKYCAWQQYVFSLQNPPLTGGTGTELIGAINTFPESGPPIIAPGNSAYQLPLVGLPSVAIPKGYTLSIILGNDSSENVNNVTWVVNGTSYSIAASPPTIPGLLTKYGLPATDVAPIVALMLTLVGPICGEGVLLKSGAGTFTYSASTKTPLKVYTSTSTDDWPSCVEFIDTTAETASCSYGALPTNPGNPFSQTFTAGPTTPLIRRTWGRPPRALRLPRP